MFNEQRYGAARKIIYLLFLLCAIALVFWVGRLIVTRLNGDMTLITADEDVCENESALMELKRSGIPVPRACDDK